MTDCENDPMAQRSPERKAMPKKRFNSRALRQLAEQLLQELAEDEEISEVDQLDLVTSLVRQWITYDGNATLFIGERQIYLVLAKTAIGELGIAPEPSPPGWMNQVIRDWKLSAEEWPDIIRQLNRGQSVEVVNSEGLPLRLWVNPKERCNGVEPLVNQPIPPGLKRDYRKIAGDQLEQLFGSELEPEAIDDFACSVAKQWQEFDGHAALFDEEHQISFTLTEMDGGSCTTSVRRESFDLESLLSSLSVPPEIIPAVIARINLGQQVEFQNNKGIPSVLWHDPKARRIMVRALPPARPAPPSVPRPIFCPKCGAVLKPYEGNEPHQTCLMCGNTV